MASTGWPVTAELSEIAGVEMFNLGHDNKYHTRVGNAMLLPFVGTCAVLALSCIRMRPGFISGNVPALPPQQKELDLPLEDFDDINQGVTEDDFRQVQEFGEEVAN